MQVIPEKQEISNKQEALQMYRRRVKFMHKIIQLGGSVDDCAEFLYFMEEKSFSKLEPLMLGSKLFIKVEGELIINPNYED